MKKKHPTINVRQIKFVKAILIQIKLSFYFIITTLMIFQHSPQFVNYPLKVEDTRIKKLIIYNYSLTFYKVYTNYIKSYIYGPYNFVLTATRFT